MLQPGIDLLERADDFPNDGPILVITDWWSSEPARKDGPLARLAPGRGNHRIATLQRARILTNLPASASLARNRPSRRSDHQYESSMTAPRRAPEKGDDAV